MTTSTPVANVNALDVINAAILGGKFTNDQLNTIIQTVQYARSRLVRQTVRALDIGDKVKFTGRRNRVVTGVVEKIMVKNVVVRPADGSPAWRVPANMLTRLAA